MSMRITGFWDSSYIFRIATGLVIAVPVCKLTCGRLTIGGKVEWFSSTTLVTLPTHRDNSFFMQCLFGTMGL